ncbi:MAG: carboxypeptidase-like regulatory domain-containing protein [Chitinophagales bacterium]
MNKSVNNRGGWLAGIVLSFLLCICFEMKAQEKKLITGDFDSTSFADFVNNVERIYPCHFYYDTSELSRFQVTIHFHQKSLENVLGLLFQNTSYHFAVDSLNEIFITKRFVIQTSLPPDFFAIASTKTDSIEIKDSGLEQPSKKLKSSLENKLFEIGSVSENPNHNKATLAGYVRESKNGEAISGATVYVDSLSVGTITDSYGYFTLTLPTGRHELHISSVGMQDTKRQILLHSDGKLNVELQDFIPILKGVTVTADRNSNIRNLQMGVARLSVKTIKQVPVVLGESDILRVVLTLPGVTTVGEASTGFNVRGGSSDQNLILFNDATIYNPSHLFGFFSAFNTDVVKGVELYKSTIPEKYGGRLSSVLDVTGREGNSKKISGTGGIGPLTSKLMIEGPIVKDKTSFILGARTTYSNWLLRSLHNTAFNNSKGNFYDADLHISHTMDPKNSFYLNGYMSNDGFRLNSDTLYQYSNRNANLKWKHIFSNKFYGVLTAGYDHYEYHESSDANKVNAFKLGFDINQSYSRADFNYSPNPKHTIDFGLNAVHYKLYPGSFTPEGSASLVVPDKLQPEQALESALYLGDLFNVSPEFSINAGLRYSVFNFLGPHDVYSYVPGLPRETATILDTLSYKKGNNIKTYGGPEIRITFRYSLENNASLKLSLTTTRQYIHMLSNTTAISPTDIWKLSDTYIHPQQGSQVSLGYYKNFASNSIETSAEIYYKQIKNYLDYKNGASLVMNHHIETDVINSRGRAYGLELMIKKSSGKLNGWLSYTYSRIFLRTDDPLAGENVNQGRYYPASYDKPNNLNFIGNYMFSHRYSFSMNFVYSTGRPITLPEGVYNYAGSQRLYYSQRNEFRIPDYFRTDISVNLEGNHKIKQLTHNSWSFGVYNLTFRQNAYSVFFVEENGIVKGYKLSIFGTAIPFITYNFRF